MSTILHSLGLPGSLAVPLRGNGGAILQVMNNTALLLIDIQDSFKLGERWERRGRRCGFRDARQLRRLWHSAD